MIENLPKVIQFQKIESGFEPRPFGSRVHSVNHDTIQSDGDEVQKAVIRSVRQHDGLGAGDTVMRLDFKQIESGIVQSGL